MKIVYCGSDVFIDVFKYLQKEHEILALFTYHKTEDYFSERNITVLAKKSGIRVEYAPITKEDIGGYLDKGCELFLTAEYAYVLPLPEGDSRFRGINIHSSLLPVGRSYYPIERAMEKGLTATGVTIHKMNEEIDRGEIIMQQEIAIPPDCDSVDVYLYCAQSAANMIKKIMLDFERYWKSAFIQTEKCPYWKRPDDSLMTITHEMTVTEALEIYRNFNSMTLISDQNIVYHVSEISSGSFIFTDCEQYILYVRDNKILYGMKDGHLRVCIYI